MLHSMMSLATYVHTHITLIPLIFGVSTVNCTRVLARPVCIRAVQHRSMILHFPLKWPLEGIIN